MRHHPPHCIIRSCRDEVGLFRGVSLEVDGYFVVRGPFVPPAQRPPGSFLDNGRPFRITVTGAMLSSQGLHGRH